MNYIVIMDFMVSELKLKGNELIIYALIYGFSQDDASDFHGSLTYMQERTGLSRQTVVDVLKKLVDKKLITKCTEFRNNLKMCVYSASQETRLRVVKKLDSSSQETRPPILLEEKLNIYNVKQASEEMNLVISEIIKYLNSKTGKNFMLEAKCNRGPIAARLNEGRSIRDIKKVIDIKSDEWKGTDMEKYLCPETLFRPGNFEKYLNQKPKNNSSSKSNSDDDQQMIENEIFGGD